MDENQQDELDRLMASGVRLSQRDAEALRALQDKLGPRVYNAALEGLAAGRRRVAEEAAPAAEPDDPLANIDSPDRDPLEGVLDTSKPEASLGERGPQQPPAARMRPTRRRAGRGAAASPEMDFLRKLRERTRYNEQLQREGMQSYYEPESFNSVELEQAEAGGSSPAMSFAPPTLEQMSSRPRPRPYTEGPMSSTEGFYGATRNSSDPRVRGAGMRFRPR